MKADAAPAASAADAAAPEPAAAPRRLRLSRKALTIGALALLVLSCVLGGAAWAFWPQPAGAPTAKAKPAVEPKVAKRKALEAAPEAERKVEQAPQAEMAKPHVEPVAQAASRPLAKSAELHRAEPHQAAASSPKAEDPMDRLRRRLAEKLGPAGTLSADRDGQLRLVSHAVGAAPEPMPVHATALHAPALNKGAAQAAGESHAAHWAYTGRTGPEAWGRLKPEFATCAKGQRQSPIDIRDGIPVELDAVQFDYQPSAFRVIDNGHTVQVNLAPGNFITVQGRRFELLQFHFHRPSEERIAGRRFDMVSHLVHKGPDGRLAVVAVLLDAGSAHPLVQTVWNNLPLEKGEEVAARVTLDLNALLPAERSYFTYMGSLTTPPCSEGVLWMVMKNPVAISAQQIGIFERLYPMNARPIQSASGRLIKESN